MNKADKINDFNKFREMCLKNAEDLLVAAKASLDVGIDHASFHLSLLALEEIGKVEMEHIHVASLVLPRSQTNIYKLDTEDHKRKLFFAFWGPSLGKEKQTKLLLETNQTLARNLHGSRLLYLYSDPGNPQYWKNLMKQGEAKKLYELAEARLKYASLSGDIDIEKIEKPDEDMVWFLDIQEDEQKRKQIWGHKSQEKLLELNNVKAWVKWLREIFDKHEKEMREIAEKEMCRQQPSEKEKMDLKWRISIEIVTPSHSIRQKNLQQYNNGVDWIKLKYKDTNTLGVDFVLTKNTPLQGLWWHGWGMCRMFVVSLNIATHGFFWWNLKRDLSRYYKEIWDLEKNIGVHIRPNEELERNWKEKWWVLKEADLSMSSLIFSYLIHCHVEKNEKHLNHYIAGLSFLAKSDIHLRLEMNAFEEFFKALKLAMIENGDWDQKQPFNEAYLNANKWRKLSEMPPKIVEDMKKLFILGFTVVNGHKGSVNLSAVYGIKEYCEVYFQTLAVRHIEERDGAKVHIKFGDKS